MNFIEIVEKKKIEARLSNIEEVRKDLKSEWVQTKIQNHIARFGGLFSKENIELEILNSDLVASMFAKDPAKQNITEKLVGELLGLPKLPSSGKNCIRFSPEGDVVSKSGSTNTKSADFLIDGCYATQKFTNEAGGAQDNQFFDVVDFLEKGSKKNKVVAIVDGLYWESGKKNQLVQTFLGNKNVVITSVQEILDGRK